MISISRRHPLLARLLLWVVLPVTVCLLAAFLFFRESLPTTSGEVHLQGLAHPVSIVTNENGIPRILAKTDLDAFFGLGYAHAQNRLWQMESQRRLGQGRLSELLGESTLPIDRYMRTLGLQQVAAANLRHLDPGAIASLEAYARGVNAWIDEEHVLPIEFYVLGTRPERWTPADSLLQIKVMALNLDRNFRLELSYSLWTKALGEKRAAQIRAEYPANAAVVAHTQEQLSARDAGNLLKLSERTDNLFRLGGEHAGSNAWVISGQYTRSGKPLLANDPHLKNQLPSIWYLVELRGDRLHVSGATIPGLPVVLAGHNASIAWGITALNADTQDVFLERVHVANDNLYEVNGQWVPMKVEQQRIGVRSPFPSFLHSPPEPVQWPVRSTRHGPLISDALGSVDSPMALSWCALKEDDVSYAAFFDLNYARNWNEFRAAIAKHTAPSLNFVYADVDGNIGYTAGGTVPVRKAGDGSLPVPAWESAFEWVGTVAPDKLPHSFNPPGGYIVSANNRVHDGSYPYFIARDWAPQYRADRIGALISDRIGIGQKLSVADVVQMQGDEKNTQAAQLVALVRGVAASSERQKQAVEYLKSWDLRADENSVAASIYHAWLRRFNRSILEEAMRTDVLRGQRNIGADQPYDQLYPLFLDKVVNGGMRGWCDIPDTSKTESCSDRALASLDDALEDLERVGGRRMANWEWGSLHDAHYPHNLFTNIRVLDSIFDRAIPQGGDSYTVNVASAVFLKEKGFRADAGATYRQVIDLGNWSQSRFINNTGQSGNVLSTHYDDFVRRNKELQLVPMTFGESAGGDTLVLVPQAKGNSRP